MHPNIGHLPGNDPFRHPNNVDFSKTDIVRLRDLDDLVLQFDATPAGKRFAQAWKKARIIVDTGGGHSDDDDKDETPPPRATRALKL